ncbi:MAG: serine hydrolase domain-containing protein [Bacteroidia bacterium]|nr:serine hydrolase domain-containing protein [Bacteroidia bacterium]
MRKILFRMLLMCCVPASAAAQPLPDAAWLDSVLDAAGQRPFNGVALLRSGGAPPVLRVRGYADPLRLRPMPAQQHFVIGSVSKQITAVLILRLADAGLLDLHAPARRCDPALPAWADSVTAHQLLTHTAGVQGYGQPLAFPPGSRFAYSGLGYEVLGRMAEQAGGRSYARQAEDLFRICGMRRSAYPSRAVRRRVRGYVRQADGTPVREPVPASPAYVPAGLLVSTAGDLLRWNEALHGGSLLSRSSYQLMTQAHAARGHFLWGEVGYGYGIQRLGGEPPAELGHSGYVPGFITLNAYYPASQTSLILLENLDWADEALVMAFSEERRILGALRARLGMPPAAE